VKTALTVFIPPFILLLTEEPQNIMEAKMKRYFFMITLLASLGIFAAFSSCKSDDGPTDTGGGSFFATSTPTITATPSITSSFTPTYTPTSTATPTFTWTPSITPVPTVCRTGGVFGDAVTTSSNNTGTGLITVSDFCLGESGSITALSLYTQEAVSLRLGVYHDSGADAPGALAFVYGPVTTTANSWNTIGVGSHAVTAGTYWIGFYADPGNPGFHTATSSTRGKRYYDNEDFPDPWNSFSVFLNHHNCIEAFYTP
jgi:hypothetical protein